MGWNESIVPRLARAAGLSLLLAGLALAPRANAQLPGTGTSLYTVLQNSYLELGIGTGTAVDGSIVLLSAPGNPGNPMAGTPVTLLFGEAVEATNNTTVAEGSLVYVRVDGGRSAGGNDYIFGRQTEGQWLEPPTNTGDKIEARWQTLVQTVNGSTIDPRIEVDLVASFVHDQARFQFTVKNNSPGQSHTVGIAFLQDIVVGKDDTSLGGPIRLPTGPYLEKETLLQGGQVPAYWDAFALGSLTGGGIPGAPSMRGVLAPRNAGETEPTRPTRFGYGNLHKLSGVGNPNTNATLFPGRDFDYVWNFTPDPTLNLQSGAIDNATIVYFDPQSIGAGQSLTLITCIGESTVDTNFGHLVALSAGGPLALGLTTTKDANGNPTGTTVTPNPFTINAYVQNQTDLNAAGISISPVTVFLNLPKGLVIATGANPQTLLNVTPGSEASANWTVMPDPANPASGKLTYTVTQSSLVGTSVQRTVEVPVPAVFNLQGTNATSGLYKMVSFPFNFGNATPSTILGLNANQPAPDFDLVRWNPTSGHYEPVNTFVPAQAYWLRSRLPNDKSIVIDTVKYPALDNQVQPTANAYPINYPKGWNQIASPDIYTVRFSEVMVFDPTSGQVVSTVDAADPVHQWIEAAVFFYDTTDTNPQNWHYVIEDNLGFDMVPYQGYWLFVNKDSLKFLYPGVDVPGASVSRAAVIGAGLGTRASRASSSDWTLQLKAKGVVSTDYTTMIGVNSKATDSRDVYKVDKPPIQENQLALDIIHTGWTNGGRLAKDLRPATTAVKTWDMTLTSSRPNEPVTISWPNLQTSVPKSYRLTLVDPATNARYDLRSVSSVAITTDSNKLRNLQVIAQPTSGRGPAVITGFDVTQNGSGSRGAGVSSVTLNYSLSQEADTRIVIRTTSGHVLRTLTGQPLPGSSTTGRAVFDMRDDQGRQVSAGIYQAELTAQSTDGSVSRQIRPVIIVR